MVSVTKLYEAKKRPGAIQAREISMGRVPSEYRRWLQQDYIPTPGSRVRVFEVDGGAFYVIREDGTDIGGVYLVADDLMLYHDERGWNSGADEFEYDEDLVQAVFDSTEKL